MLPQVRRWRQALEDFRNIPFQETKDNITKGTARPCVVASLLQEINKSDTLAENTIRDCAAVAFGGGILFLLLIHFKNSFFIHWLILNFDDQAHQKL